VSSSRAGAADQRAPRRAVSDQRPSRRRPVLRSPGEQAVWQLDASSGQVARAGGCPAAGRRRRPAGIRGGREAGRVGAVRRPARRPDRSRRVRGRTVWCMTPISSPTRSRSSTACSYSARSPGAASRSTRCRCGALGTTAAGAGGGRWHCAGRWIRDRRSVGGLLWISTRAAGRSRAPRSPGVITVWRPGRTGGSTCWARASSSALPGRTRQIPGDHAESNGDTP